MMCVYCGKEKLKYGTGAAAVYVCPSGHKIPIEGSEAGPLSDWEVNDWLHEAFGYCWHEWRAASSGMTCTKCGFRVPYHTDPPDNPNYCADPVRVLREMRKREDWDEFCGCMNGIKVIEIDLILDNPGKLARMALEWVEVEGGE